ASKFTQHGGVTLSLSAVDQSRVRFVVADTGIGIPDDRLALIFEPFVQAAGHYTFKRFGGAGLGLSICKQLVGLMQGTIHVASQVGQGSTFTFVLPLEPMPEQANPLPLPRPDGLAEVAVARAGLRILAVDDAEENLQLLDAFLKGTAHRLTVARDGAEAVSLFQANPFDLVLMDIQMPVMDGYDATRAMRRWEGEQNRPATPIVAFTAHAMKEVSEEVLAAGCNDVLTKPIRKKSLLSVLERY
ncbi:MAG: response regulator, partial [Magnetococcus sp. YQC-3]